MFKFIIFFYLTILRLWVTIYTFLKLKRHKRPHIGHCAENHIFFFQTSWKMVFPKKSRWNLVFLVLSGKMIFLFSENMILPPDGKWKMIFLKKIYVLKKKFKYSEKMVFSKRIAPEHDLSCTIWKGGIFFPKTWYFFPGRKTKEGWPFSRNTRKHDISYLICSTPPPARKKNQRRSYPTKIHLKVIDIPDRHLRKGSSNSRYLHRDLYRRFHILLSSKKSQEI